MSQNKIDSHRYRKIRWFFAKTFLRFIWSDILLNRPILRWFRTPPLPRWKEVARQYRSLAVEMGGVLIKLGQFLSIRVDILPPEVTHELAGLQDEVPPEKTEAIIAQIEADFRRPISEIFEWFSPQPLGAASLAQAHLARIRMPETRNQKPESGYRNSKFANRNLKYTEVVVKVLRPGIDVIVETDLAAIRLAFKWLKLYKRIRDRVDLDWLAKEFTSVTRNELDFQVEGKHTERLAKDFEDNPDVYIPKIYWEYCAARTLTMENVSYIKISDLKGIESAGIRRSQVADTLYHLYMTQVFETFFVHVDPHPGNLFVKPLPHPDEISAGVMNFKPNEPIPYKPNRPFQIVFVDFGMAVTIPERLRNALREYAIGIGTRDAHKIVQSLINAGTLLPGADLRRLEEVHEAMFEQFWGVQVGQIRDLAFNEALDFAHEYRDVIFEAPIQFQADMLFVVRAIGMLSGMAANLDPDFDVWNKTIPYAERYAKEEIKKDWRRWVQEAVIKGHSVLELPVKLENMMTQTQQGNLTIQTEFSPDSQKQIAQLEKSLNRIRWVISGIGLLISGSILHIGSSKGIFDEILMLIGILLLLCGMRKI